MVSEIANSSIHYSPVSNLSDPFDCLISSRRIYNKLGVFDSDSDDSSLIHQICKSVDVFIHDQINICCFTESYNSFSMWDRFANGHKGICIEYDVRMLKDLALTPLKIKYSKKPFSMFNKNANDFEEYLLDHLGGCVLTKNLEYRAEKEWRLLNPIEEDRSVGDAIRRVYIGCKCSKGKNKVIQECKKRGIEIVKMESDDMSYSFIEKPVVFRRA